MKRKILLFTATFILIFALHIYAGTDSKPESVVGTGTAYGILAVGPGGIQAWTEGYASTGLYVHSYYTGCSGVLAPSGATYDNDFGGPVAYYPLGNPTGSTFTWGNGVHTVYFGPTNRNVTALTSASAY